MKEQKKNILKFSQWRLEELEREGTKIPVVIKKDLIKLMEMNRKNYEDVRILKLLDDPVKNADEINDSQ